MQQCLVLVFAQLPADDVCSLIRCGCVSQLWRKASSVPYLWRRVSIARVAHQLGRQGLLEQLEEHCRGALTRDTVMRALESLDKPPMVPIDPLPPNPLVLRQEQWSRLPSERVAGLHMRMEQRDAQLARKIAQLQRELWTLRDQRSLLFARSSRMHPIYQGAGRMLLRAGIECASDPELPRCVLGVCMHWIHEVCASLAGFLESRGVIGVECVDAALRHFYAYNREWDGVDGKQVRPSGKLLAFIPSGRQNIDRFDVPEQVYLDPLGYDQEADDDWVLGSSSDESSENLDDVEGEEEHRDNVEEGLAPEELAAWSRSGARGFGECLDDVAVWQASRKGKEEKGKRDNEGDGEEEHEMSENDQGAVVRLGSNPIPDITLDRWWDERQPWALHGVESVRMSQRQTMPCFPNSVFVHWLLDNVLASPPVTDPNRSWHYILGPLGDFFFTEAALAKLHVAMEAAVVRLLFHTRRNHPLDLKERLRPRSVPVMAALKRFDERLRESSAATNNGPPPRMGPDDEPQRGPSFCSICSEMIWEWGCACGKVGFHSLPGSDASQFRSWDFCTCVGPHDAFKDIRSCHRCSRTMPQYCCGDRHSCTTCGNEFCQDCWTVEQSGTYTDNLYCRLCVDDWSPDMKRRKAN